MPNALDFSSYAEPATDANALDFSAQAEPVREVGTGESAMRGLVRGGGALLNTLDAIGNAMDPSRAISQALMRQSMEQAAEAQHPSTLPADWFTREASLEFGPHADPAAAQALFDQAEQQARRDQQVQSAIKQALDPLGALADQAAEYGALQPNEITGTAGKFVGGVTEAVPQLAAAIATGGESALPEMLPAGVKSVPVLGRVLTAIARGTPTAAALTTEQATNLPDDLSPGEKVAATAKAAGINTVLAGLPGAVGGTPLLRTGTGAAIGYGTSAAQSALEGREQDQTQNAVGGFIGALLGGAHSMPERDPFAGWRFEPVPGVAPGAEAPGQRALPRGADFSAQAEPVRPTAPNPGPVHVDTAGTAATVPQGASAFAQALAARMAGVEPGLPEPAVRVDAQGNAMTTADQHAAMQPVPPAEPDPLGLTERLRALVAADPRSAREGAPIVPEGPRALPAPVVAVDRTGQAMTPMQQAQARAAEAAKAAERAQLGITPDIERTQGVRWSKQADYATREAERQARIKELDDAIAAREAKNKPARGMNARPDESTDDALTFLAKKGGLDRRAFVSEGLDPKLARAPENLTRGGASRPLFRAQGNGGLTLDQAAEALWQHGYLDSQDNNAALDLILHGVNQGEMAYSIHRAPQDDLLSLKQARQDADHHVTDDYADVPFSRKPADARTAAGLTREQFLGSPRITPDSNAAELTPKALTTVTSAPAEPFMGGRYEAKFSPDGAVVLDRGKAIASYNFGDTLAVAKPYRRQGIATELVAEWRRRYPASATAKTRTKAAQRVQERAFDRLAGDPRFSFAGERARTADRGALEQAQQMEAMGRDSVPDRYGNQPGSPEDTHIATGWHRGVDGKWRFEIDDSQATLHSDRISALSRGGIAPQKFESVSHQRQPDGTYNLDLIPANPKQVSDIHHLHNIPAEALDSILPKGVAERVRRGDGEDDLMGGDLGDAKRIRGTFQFGGLNAMPLDLMLDHPALFKAYPELANVTVHVNPDLRGLASYSAKSNMIEVRPLREYRMTGDASLKSVLLHEIQHAIQNHEGFARGGSSAEARTLPEFEQALRQQMAERGGELPDWNEVKPTQPDEIKAAQAVYRRLAGEVEARNTQRRMNMDKGERRAVPPTETADVPRHQQIVRFNADRANAEPGTIDKPLPREQMERAPLGAWVEGPRVPGVDRPDLFQVRDVPLEKLHLPELDSAGELVPEKKRDGDAYTERLRRGEQAPNARGYELPNGQIKVVDGHRRAVAAMNAGRDTLRVAVSPIDQPAAHVAHAEPASHADLDAIAKYNRVLTRYIGADVHLAPAAHVPDDAVAALAGIDRLLGGRTIPVDNHNRAAIDFDGVTLQDGTRLVDAEATAPLVTVTLHETFHQMEKDAPDLAGEVHAYIREHGATHAYHAVLQERARQNGEDPERIGHDRAVSELSADAVADAMSDPAFLEGMAKRNPGLFRRVADAIMASLNRVLKHLRRTLGSSSYLDDVQAFRDHLAGIMDRYAQRVQARARGEAAPERGASTDPALSRKPADDQTQTPAFRKWFGDSKVVDAEGRPLVVYHGTASDVPVFRHSRFGHHYFTDDPAAASVYADVASPHDANGYMESGENGIGPNVMPVYLSIKNPLVLDGKWQRENMDDDGEWNWEILDQELYMAEGEGHDGAILHGFMDYSGSVKGEGRKERPYNQYVAFKPEQIKSATGNRGTFDPNEPSILFSRKPAPSEAEYLQDMPSRRPGESQNAYLRRVTRKNGEDIKAATALVKQQRSLGRAALRGMMATQARQMAIADAALDAARKTFDKTPDVINFASVHQWETGQPIADADFRHFVATMQDGFDQRIAEIQRLAPGALQSLIEHYMPHLYEDSGKAAKWYQNVLGKRPLEGDKSFLKQRTWPTLKEAMASGLKPISPNPVDWVLMKYAQMDKFIGLLRLKEEFTRRGWLMKMEPGQRAPEGFARVDDPAFQVAGGLQGYFAVPELIAKDINNYLAPGLSKYGAWRSVRAVQNAMVSWNLGWSAFHAGFTSIDNAVTHGAVGLQRLVDGDLSGGLMALVKAVPTMVTSPFEGGKLNRQWTGRESADPHTAALLDLLEQGGARMKMGNASAEYNNALPQVMRTIRRLQAPGALADGLEALQRRLTREPAKTLAETGWGTLKGVGKAISAIGEVGSFLIHHVLVPNQKMAARVTLLKFELDRYAQQLGKQRGDYTGILSVMNPDVARQLATDVVDKVDFRLGQMTYDNFFYPKIAREIAQLLVMAPGWQAGAFQTMTGGLKDIGRLAKPEKLVGPLDKAGRITDAHRGRFTNNLANLAMLFLMVGGGNALYQWLVSGIEPDEMKDLVAPRTGRKNADDSDERIVLPSYMKDHYEFFHHPLAMASHKLHPAWRLMWEIGHNEDYFGTMIRDPHHPLGQQAKELAGYLVKSMLPFTATNAAKVAENGGGVGEHVANFVGITPASASLARTPFQAFVAKGGARGWEFPAATPAEAEYQDRMRKAETAMRTGQTPATDGLTARDLAKLKRRVQTLKPELQFDRLSLADKLDAYDMATPEERRRYHLTDILRRTNPRRSVAFRRLPEEEQQAMLEQLRAITQHGEAIGP